VWVVVLALWPDDPPPRTGLPQWLAQLQAADGIPWHCVTRRTSLRTFADFHVPAQHAWWYHLVRAGTPGASERCPGPVRTGNQT
jgi:hypothetical protein